MAATEFLIFPERGSHFGHFKNRNWKAVNNYWHSITKSGVVPTWISNPSHSYGVTDLQSIHQCGMDEFALAGQNTIRTTYAVRVGYAGSHYQGYQSQGSKLKSILTVEDDIREALGRSVMAAGRTDKGVSALSQVISFYINKEKIPESEILRQLRNHPSAQEGRLAFFDCQIVPRKFHALFSATWRRYMYLYPLNDPQQAREIHEKKTKKIRRAGGTVDDKINTLSGHSKENDDEDGEENEEEKDSDEGDHEADQDKHNDQYPLDDVVYYPTSGPFEGDFSLSQQEISEKLIDVDIPYLNEMLDRITNRTLHFNGFAYKEIRGSEENRGDECILYVARAFLVDISNSSSLLPSSSGASQLAATLIRECQIPHSQRETNILEKICESSFRDRAAFPAPSSGLCMTGVGYDLEDLAKPKFIATNPKTIEKNKRKRQEREEALRGESLERSNTHERQVGEELRL